jgi:glycine dehydrogenase subunit 1
MKVVETYCKMSHIELLKVPQMDGATDTEVLKNMLGDDVSCFYVQQPNYFGIVEDGELISQLIHDEGAKFIMGFNPIAMAILKTPGECGADIAVGEGQPLGLPLSFGGPYLGIMACKKDMIRKLPGRIVGQTTDIDGRRAFVLTLQAREQHIRREKASSNICSNQAHCALTAAIYMAAMGPAEMVTIANQCHSKAAYASKKISAIKGFDLVFDKPFFHEFVTRCPIPVEQVMSELEAKDILGGQPLKGELEGCILWCVTERIIKDEIDQLTDILSCLVSGDNVEVTA